MSKTMYAIVGQSISTDRFFILNYENTKSKVRTWRYKAPISFSSNGTSSLCNKVGGEVMGSSPTGCNTSPLNLFDSSFDVQTLFLGLKTSQVAKSGMVNMLKRTTLPPAPFTPHWTQQIIFHLWTAQNMIYLAWATWAPSNLPDKLSWTQTHRT